MTANLEVVNPIDCNDWNNLVQTNKDASFFHSWNWANVISKTYRYTPLYFISKEKLSLAYLLPIMEVDTFFTRKRGVSLPFTDYCEPLLGNSNPDLKEVFHYGLKADWEYLEIRGGKKIFNKENFSNYYIVHTLNIDKDERDILKTFRNSTKRNIKKAKKENVSVMISQSKKSIDEFCRLNYITRKRHGVPPQPYKFFENIYKYIMSYNQGYVILAFHRGKVVAAAIFFYFNKEVIYKYGASNPKFLDLRANNLIMWEAIKWSCDNGYKRFSFGRTEPENRGLMQYKSGWGAQEYAMPYFKYEFKKGKFVKKSNRNIKIYPMIFNVMPLCVSKIIGKVVYSHMA